MKTKKITITLLDLISAEIYRYVNEIAKNNKYKVAHINIGEYEYYNNWASFEAGLVYGGSIQGKCSINHNVIDGLDESIEVNITAEVNENQTYINPPTPLSQILESVE